MAKTHLKYVWFQKVIQTVNLYIMQKTYKRRKAKEKLKLKKYNPNTRKHEFFIEKKLPPHSK